MPFMQGSAFSKRIIIATILSALSMGIALAQVSASHVVSMGIRRSNRISISPAVASESTLDAANKDGVIEAKTMNLSYSSGGSAESRKTIVSVAGVVLPGVSLSIAAKNREKAEGREWRTEVKPVPVSFDLAGLAPRNSHASRKGGDSAITLTVSSEDPSTEAGFIIVTYTII